MHRAEVPDGPVEVRHVQPYQAVKTYRCPGCDHEIPPGLGHEVVVPLDAPEDRRHWHTACWRRVEQRAPCTRPAQNAASITSITGGAVARREHRRDVEAQRARARASGARRASCIASARRRRCLVTRDRLGRAGRTRCERRVFTSQNTIVAVAAERRGRARPRGSASCGRAPRSRRPRTSAATASSPAAPSARRVGRRHALRGPCRRAPRC